MFFGSGVLRGMLVTLKNFINSYFRKSEDGGLFTVQYPENRLPAITAFRNFPFLVFDDKPENLRCTACDICAKECPPKCIYIVRDSDPDGKPLKRPAVFDIDFGLCMNCGICEEVCPFDSIYMDNNFEVSAAERQNGLRVGLEGLSKSNEHFHKIRHADATAIDEKLRLAAEKKAAAAKAAAERARLAKEQKPPAAPPPEKPETNT